jgi:glycerate kinase
VRVLICPDRMGPLSSARAGRALAQGWPAAETYAVGEAGGGFVEATAEGWQAMLQTAVVDWLPVEWAAAADAVVLGGSGPGRQAGIPYEATSFPLGRAVSTILGERRPQRLLVDLAGVDVHDAGAGLLAALGATATGSGLTGGVAGLTGLTGVDPAPVRRLLDGVELIGVVPTPQRDDLLLGLRGITSRRGREAGEDPAALLTTDAALEQLTDLVAPGAAAVPGSGACGGLGWAFLALGGRLTTGPDLGLAAATARYDLVVTGCGVFDFATRGGGVVAAAAALAGDRLAPCVVVAGEVMIGSREMRTMGVEAAYAIRDSTLDAPTGGDLTAAEVQRAAVRVARSWRW